MKHNKQYPMLSKEIESAVQKDYVDGYLQYDPVEASTLAPCHTVVRTRNTNHQLELHHQLHLQCQVQQAVCRFEFHWS